MGLTRSATSGERSTRQPVANFSSDIAEVTLQAVSVFENLIHRLELASPVEIEGLKESLPQLDSQRCCRRLSAAAVV